jgi:hypothetical protein
MRFSVIEQDESYFGPDDRVKMSTDLRDGGRKKCFLTADMFHFHKGGLLWHALPATLVGFCKSVSTGRGPVS